MASEKIKRTMTYRMITSLRHFDWIDWFFLVFLIGIMLLLSHMFNVFITFPVFALLYVPTFLIYSIIREKLGLKKFH